MEDPVSAFFTENIIYFGGNFTVFPGINSHGTVLVNTYLECILILDNDLPDNFKEVVHDGVQCMLALCNEVATKASLKRYIFQPSTKSAIKVPDKPLYDRLRESVLIHQKTVELLAERYGFKIAAVEHFTVDPTIDDFSDDDPENNPVAQPHAIQSPQTFDNLLGGAVNTNVSLNRASVRARANTLALFFLHSHAQPHAILVGEEQSRILSVSQSIFLNLHATKSPALSLLENKPVFYDTRFYTETNLHTIPFSGELSLWHRPGVF
jgi:hypothetical protein